MRARARMRSDRRARSSLGPLAYRQRRALCAGGLARLTDRGNERTRIGACRNVEIGRRQTGLVALAHACVSGFEVPRMPGRIEERGGLALAREPRADAEQVRRASREGGGQSLVFGER